LLPNLKGCLADADAMVGYLQGALNVSSDRIVSLRDEKATKAAIVENLRAFAHDKRIQRGDPILIYFAGHGVSVPPPPEWPGGTNKIQMLVPWDFDVNSAETTTQGLYDFEFATLLNQIACEKGDNIVRL
jgi:hypothetical protein